jgi:hypothetical protein
MLDAIRLIVQGHNSPAPTEAARNALETFSTTARDRWRQLVEDLPPNDDARMPHGHYEVGFEFVG